MPNEPKDQTPGQTIELPCQIVERVERYAKENGADVGEVLIEALDQFLRKRVGRSDQRTKYPKVIGFAWCAQNVPVKVNYLQKFPNKTKNKN
jgi:hypothetical protein